MYKCDTCFSNFLNIIDYNEHHLLHHNLPNCKVSCKFKGCSKEFESYENFRKHVYRIHIINLLFKYENKYECKKKIVVSNAELS